MPADLEHLLADLLRASLDDERIRLPPRAERRLVERMTELAQLAHYEIVATTQIATGATPVHVKRSLPLTRSTTRSGSSSTATPND